MIDREIMVVVGETSGDRHAAGLVKALRSRFDEELKFFGSGGSSLRDLGVEVLSDVSRLSAIGPWAALQNVGSYIRLFRELLAQARRRRPALAILVDFPDFNLRLAARLKRIGVPVCYFISPQLWAWRQSRVKQIRRNVDLMLVIFPFEEDFYRSRKVNVSYVGNPTAARFAESGLERKQELASPPRVALLPGSRRKELELILPVQLEAARILRSRMEVQFELIKAPEIVDSELNGRLAEWQETRACELEIDVVEGDSLEMLSRADAALVKSGTSTLEAMLAGVPFAMVYRIAPMSWYLLKPFVATDTYCLANWIAGERVVPEFVQFEARSEAMADFLYDSLMDQERRSRQQRRLSRAAAKLGCEDAYAEAARRIIEHFFAQKAA